MLPMHQSVRKAVFGLVALLLIFALFFSSCSAASISDTFTYGPNGNMLNGSGFAFEYNDANQLVKIINESDSSTVAEYFYDANGQRVKKIEGGATTYYIGDYVETQVNGSTVDNTSYYFANTERVARKDPDGSLYCYHGDHLGSTSVVTNESGAQSEKVAYYPYGSLKEQVGEGSTYLFTDQEYDDESGLYYYGARYYNPELTRFTQPDTITQNVYNPQNLNRYAYVLNNPVKYVDPTGNCFFPFLFSSDFESANPSYWFNEYLKWGESNRKAFEEATGIRAEAIDNALAIGSMCSPLGEVGWIISTYSALDTLKSLPAPRVIEGTNTKDILNDDEVTILLFEGAQIILHGPPTEAVEGLSVAIQIEQWLEKANELQNKYKIGTTTTTGEDIGTTTTTTTSSYPPTGMSGRGL